MSRETNSTTRYLDYLTAGRFEWTFSADAWVSGFEPGLQGNLYTGASGTLENNNPLETLYLYVDMRHGPVDGLLQAIDLQLSELRELRAQVKRRAKKRSPPKSKSRKLAASV